jgi:AcrR family transcriptional regulator
MLAVAGRIFARRGLHEASMDEIAEAAGTSKPMLYLYFGSKEGLYIAYVELSYRELIAAIDAAVAGARGAGPWEQLRVGAIAYFQYVGVHRDAFAVLFREMGDPGGKLARPRLRLHNRVVAALNDSLRVSRRKAIHPQRADPLAEAFLGAARALANWWLDHPEVSAEAVADQLIGFAMVGLRGLLAADSQPI